MIFFFLEMQESAKKSIERRSGDNHVRNRKDLIKGLRRYVQIYKLSVNKVSIEELLSCVRSARVFKKRACKNKSQDIKDMLNVTVN